MGMMINRRRAYGGKSLPYDAEIEYIRIGDLQYIELPINVSSNLISDIYCTIDIDNAYNAGLIFNRYQTYYPQYAYTVVVNPSYNPNYIRIDYGSSNVYAQYISVTNFIGNNHIVFGKGKIIFNGEEFLLNNRGQTFTSPLNYYIIGSNISSSYHRSWKLNSLSITDNDTIVFDLIPVRVGTTGYLYDKVSGQLFGNAGTGNFILGPDKVVLPSGYKQLEYIESTGTQYIDTGIKAAGNLDIKIRAQITEFNSSLFGSRVVGSSQETLKAIYFGCQETRTLWLYGDSITHNNKPALSLNTWYNINTVGGKYYKDGTLIAQYSDVTITDGINILLFAIHSLNSDKPFTFSHIKVSSFVIEGFINLIPCRRNLDNVVGMYDTITGTFFTNQGTGEFIAGPEV